MYPTPAFHPPSLPGNPGIHLPNPHSPSSIPFVNVPDVRHFLWAYRVLRSLKDNRTGGQLLHQPYYRPVSTLDQGVVSTPSLLGGEHLFEWRSPSHRFPLIIVLLSINPLLQYSSPQVVISNHLVYSCPQIHISHWDCPFDLPDEARESIEQLGQSIDEDLTNFVLFLETFCLHFYTPVPPYDRDLHSPLRPDVPPPPPLSPTNPNTVPLGPQQ